jgi:hypothetical protein
MRAERGEHDTRRVKVEGGGKHKHRKRWNGSIETGLPKERHTENEWLICRELTVKKKVLFLEAKRGGGK